MNLLIALAMAAVFDQGSIQSVTLVDARGYNHTIAVCEPLFAERNGVEHIVAAEVNCARLHVPDNVSGVHFRLLMNNQVMECWNVEVDDGAIVAPIMECD